MNVSERWECQKCLQLYKTKAEADACHPAKHVYVCGHCGVLYNSAEIASVCGWEGAGPSKVDIKAFKNIVIKKEDED